MPTDVSHEIPQKHTVHVRMYNIFVTKQTIQYRSIVIAFCNYVTSDCNRGGQTLHTKQILNA